MVEFIIGAFIVVLIRNKFVSNVNTKAGYELYPTYHLKPLFKHWSIYLPLFMGLTYVYLEFCVFRQDYWFVPYQQQYKTITLLCYLPLIFKYILYESAWTRFKSKNNFISIITSPMVIGTMLIALGTILNIIAIKSNNGYMPVFPSLTYSTGYMGKEMFNDGLHILGGFDTKLIPLTDIFDLFGYSVASVGDLFVRAYAFIILYFSIKNSNTLLLK